MSAAFPPFPEGFRARPLTIDDAERIAVLVADCEEFEDGIREMTTGDVLSLWNRPGSTLAACSIGVFESDTLVAGGDVFDGHAAVHIHPDFRRRGLGSALLPWTWAVARGQGAKRIGQTVSDRRPDAGELFRAHGYRPGPVGWVLEMDLAGLGEPRFPDGYEIADLVYGRDAREVFEVIDAAFSETREGPGEDFGEWDGFMSTNPAMVPWASPVIRREGRVVGAAISFDYGRDHAGWIHVLAVDRAHRGLGIGRALIEASFARFRERGFARGGLATNSRLGALGLYEHIGMSVRHSYTHWSKTL